MKTIRIHTFITGVLLVGLFVLGVILYPKEEPVEPELEDPARVKQELGESEKPKQLKVHLSGAVKHPGVYPFEEGDRLEDLIQKAGGVCDEADLTSVNLAMHLQDATRVHIPFEGEDFEEIPPNPQSSEPGKVSLNRASLEELMTLSGVGEVKAKRIIEYREKKPFESLEDLLEISGFGEKLVQQLKEQVIID